MPLRPAVTPVEPAAAGLSAVLLQGSSGVARAPRTRGEPTLCFVYAGAAEYFVAGRFALLPAGTLAAFWGALPHRLVRLTPDAELMQLELPLSMLLRWRPSSALLTKLLAGELMLDTERQSFDAELTRGWLTDLASGKAAQLGTCELELEARLRRLAMRRRTRGAATGSATRARQLAEQIGAYLGERYRDDISTADIGRALGLHPNYAMTLFRREAGLSIWQYLIRLRLAHAQRALLQTDKAVLAVALESGFGSLARFYAAFTRTCSLSPAEFRKRSLAPPAL